MTEVNKQKLVVCSALGHAPVPHDFGQLWEGAPEVIVGHASANWGGALRGRPVLAEQLWPHILRQLEGQSSPAIQGLQSSIRVFYRFLDAYEQAFDERINSLQDVNAALSVVWLAPVDQKWKMPSHSAYCAVGKIIKDAHIAVHGRERPYLWAHYPKAGKVLGKNLPNHDSVRYLIRSLKNDVRAIYARWERCDKLASTGVDLRSIYVPRELRKGIDKGGGPLANGYVACEADAHATYRGIITDTGNPFPSPSEIREAFGLGAVESPSLKRLGFWPKNDFGEAVSMEQLKYGLYPSRSDVSVMAGLFIAQSGWNASTLLSLDISSSEWAQPHGMVKSSRLMMLQSWKARSKQYQWVLSIEKMKTGPYQIIKRLIDRTSSIRSFLGAGSDVPKETLLLSPWVYVGGIGAYASTATALSIAGKHSGAGLEGWWKAYLTKYNKQAPEGKRFSGSVTLSDFRDIFAEYVFKTSRYNWLYAQWALGHKSVKTTRHYLRTLMWKRAGEAQLLKITTILIDGLEVSARVDPVEIRARAEFNYEPSEADIDRLEKYREKKSELKLTYSGYYCSDPTHPPREIDPSNPSDGSVPCRRQERCGGCIKGQAVDGFYLARRVVELRHIRSQVSVTGWSDSHQSSDLDALEASLKQWDEVEVEKWVAEWSSAIQEKRHMVIWSGVKR